VFKCSNFSKATLNTRQILKNINPGFSFLSETTYASKKTTDFAEGQGWYFNVEDENTTDFNSIFTDGLNCQSVNNENLLLVKIDYTRRKMINSQKTVKVWKLLGYQYRAWSDCTVLQAHLTLYWWQRSMAFISSILKIYDPSGWGNY
jgi:hypothetical protein